METILVFLGVFGVSALIRKGIGYPIRYPKTDNLMFKTTWVTGYPAFSHGFVIVGSNCMWVHVTKEKAIIRMHFPFSIFLIPELFGIGWEFEKDKLISCTKTLFGVRVRYRGFFTEREFVVNVGDKDGFIYAISNA